MSNQFPPGGYGQGEGYPQSGNQPNNSGYGAPQGNSGYQSSTGDYQGYQAQSSYQGYGNDQGSSQQGDYSSYGSYGQSNGAPSSGYGQSSDNSGYGQDASYGQQAQVYGQQDASNAYGGYGQDSQGGYGQGYGADGSSGYGQNAGAGYGQDSYGQYGNQSAYGQPGGDPNAGYGAYNNQQHGYAPQGEPKKKGPAGWVWAVVAVLGLALVGGLIWGGIALFGGGGGFGGGPDYSIESSEVASDADVTYNGDWKESAYSSSSSKTYESPDGQCVYAAAYSTDMTADIDPNDVRGSMKDSLDEALAGSTGSGVELNIEELDTMKKKDTEGIEVEFLSYKVEATSSYGGTSDQGVIFIAVHPFSDSGNSLAYMMMCNGNSADESDFREQFDATEFTLIRDEEN